MFERIGRLAERAATGVGVSRRGFLGRLGQSALGVAGVLAGLAATAATAKGAGSYACCTWNCYQPLQRHHVKAHKCYPPGTNCHNLYGPCSYGGPLIGSKTVSSCTQCK